jgi:hypothetical protein
VALKTCRLDDLRQSTKPRKDSARQILARDTGVGTPELHDEMESFVRWRSIYRLGRPASYGRLS